MNDNQIFIIIIGILRAGFNSLSLSDVLIKKNYQPTQQGTPENRTVFIHKINSPLYGFPGYSSTYNKDDGDFDTVESFWETPSFQISALAQQDPSQIDSLTSSDLVTRAAKILQTRATIDTLIQLGIGIDRIQNIRPSYFVNDKERYEQSSSFDFTLSFRVETNTKTPAVTAYEANIQQV